MICIEELKEVVSEIGKHQSNKIREVCDKDYSNKLSSLFLNCFINTAKTTAFINNKGRAFVMTGDIPAMWLRDSSAQVNHYIPYIKKYKVINEFIRELIISQFFYINIDPYANAFNIEPNDNGHKDITDTNPWVWERKYEIDSLCYPVSLLYKYYKETNDTSIFTEDIKKGLELIVDLFITEQNHEDSSYSFERLNCVQSDTLLNNGKGPSIKYTGMTWSGFRPSDDACKYGYLIPSNIFALEILNHIQLFLTEIFDNEYLLQKVSKLILEIKNGIENFGICNHELYGRIYAYEVDGLGNINLMDDANSPSLLSIPYFSNQYNREIYENTRKFVLSKYNPYYYEGSFAKGIGSPHTPENYIWHIALSIQGLTSKDRKEQRDILEMLISTDAETGYMHEGFNKDNPKQFTREWFAWSNSIFAEYVELLLENSCLNN